MARKSSDNQSPTMIVPKGAEIELDQHGQLSIRTPGNLVIQNSGHYGTIESVNGSIRIERQVDVEAVNVRCGDVCFVEGTLTAWKVSASSIHLQDGARANIVLQETQGLDVGRDARLVGNFESEKELFGLFSRFADQLRTIPMFTEREPGLIDAAESPDSSTSAATSEPPDEVEAEIVIEATVEDTDEPASAESAGSTGATVSSAPKGSIDSTGSSQPVGPGTGAPRRVEELPDPLFFALVLLEREFGLSTYGPTSQRSIEAIIKLLRDRDLETLHMTFQTLFGRIVEPGRDVNRAQELVQTFLKNHFAKTPISRIDRIEPVDREH